MQRACVLSFLAVLLLSRTHSSAQETSTAVKEPLAMTVLTEVVNRSGWTSVPVTDYRFVGTATYFLPAPTTAQSTVIGRGTEQCRTDTLLPSGTRAWAISGKTGKALSEGGQVAFLPRANLGSLAASTVPYPLLQRLRDDPSVSVLYLGVESVLDGQTHRVRTYVEYSEAQDRDGTRRLASTLEVFVDAATFRVVKVLGIAHPRDGRAEPHIRETRYGNYGLIGGVTVPLDITVSISGQDVWRFEGRDFLVNTGLTDSDFLLQ